MIIKMQQRKKLTNKLAAAFFEELRDLSPEMQAILLDDFVTAFETRLTFFQKLKNEDNTQLLPTNLDEQKIIQA